MCCRLTVQPFDPEIAKAILLVGQFVVDPIYSTLWTRKILEEGTEVHADLSKEFSLSITPSISSYAGHADKRLAGGVYFEIAAKYAEKVGGTIVQNANIGLCIVDGVNQHVLAIYPDLPLRFERCCPGFQEVFLGQGN